MKKYIRNRHPGEFLKKDLLKDMGITQYKLARAIGVPQTYISDIVKEKRRISTEMGLLLDKFFGFSEGYFDRLQSHYDLMEAKRKIATRLNNVIPYQHGHEAQF